jgi:hypothetical protein
VSETTTGAGGDIDEAAGSESPASSPAIDLPAEATLWNRDDWMQAWLETEPLLGSENLAPYFYFARDRLYGSTSAAQRMSPTARELYDQLLSPSSVVRDATAPRLRSLSSPDVVAILEGLVERVRASDTTAEASNPFHGLLTLVSARPELASEFATVVRSLPASRFTPGMPNRLLGVADKMDDAGKEAIRSILAEWQAQAGSPNLATAAGLALSMGR